jgi:hypothetical protein
MSAPQSAPENRLAVLSAGWFWNTVAIAVVGVGIGCLVAATSVDVPACRLPGRLEAEDGAGSWVGGAIVASALAFVAALVGRSRTRRSRRFVATFATLSSTVALGLAAVGYWLALVFPCATD